MHNLAKEVTCLEDDIREYGSITIKDPDVWGDTNLMFFIQEYEKELHGSMSGFTETVQAYIYRSDQAELQSMTSLGVGLSKANPGGTGGAGGGGGGGAPASSTPSQSGAPSSSAPSGKAPSGSTPSGGSTPASGSNPSGTSSPSTGNQPSSPSGPPTPPDVTPIQLTPDTLFAGLTKALTAVKPTATGGIGLEPTEKERQHSTYVKVNQALRQLNMGDDNSRMAGYGLYKLRIPVSVLPGCKTHKGYSAVVTLRAQLEIDANHLRYTFPKLAVADLVDTLVPVLEANWQSGIAPPPPTHVEPARGGPKPYAARGPSGVTQIALRTAGNEDVVAVFGAEQLNCLLDIVRHEVLPPPNTPDGRPKTLELREFLLSYFDRMQKILEAKHVQASSADVIVETGKAIEAGCIQRIDELRFQWYERFPKDCPYSLSQVRLSWLLAAQDAILDRNLKESLRGLQRTGKLSHGSGPGEIEAAQFFNPEAPPETLRLWEEFIRTVFPVHVFTLEPLVEEQNVYDAFSRQRDLQLAMAFALANGRISASQALKFSRKLTLDMATIALNRTAVAFAADNDTFGWYFYPRVQTPPEEMSNIVALARLIWSTGPTRTYDLHHRELEPGIRECEVLMVMPSFVPYLRFDVTTNWEKLHRPGRTKLGYEDIIDEGAHFQQVKALAAEVVDQDNYRPGDYERLVSRVQQLEKMLPLQTYHMRVPYQYDTPGSDLVDTGNAYLKPVVYDYYGLEFLSTTAEAQVFISGRNFHPTLTRVIAGGTESASSSTADTTIPKYEVEVISRELIRVHIQGISTQLSANPVRVRVATRRACRANSPSHCTRRRTRPRATGMLSATPLLRAAARPRRTPRNRRVTLSRCTTVKQCAE
jgi:hypothetical protein